MFKKVELIEKTLDPDKFPLPQHPEFPLVGRSNVGKSTFLNRILKRKIAKVSKSPGRTRSLDFYLIEKSFVIVDLPGFGYAKVGESLKRKWDKALRRYFKRENIIRVVHLIDFSLPPQQKDLEVSEWLYQLGLEEVILFTKIDKFSKSKFKTQQVKQQAFWSRFTNNFYYFHRKMEGGELKSIKEIFVF